MNSVNITLSNKWGYEVRKGMNEGSKEMCLDQENWKIEVS